MVLARGGPGLADGEYACGACLNSGSGKAPEGACLPPHHAGFFFLTVRSSPRPCPAPLPRPQLGKESRWNVDGELLPSNHITAEVHRGLIEVFARGVER